MPLLHLKHQKESQLHKVAIRIKSNLKKKKNKKQDSKSSP